MFNGLGCYTWSNGTILVGKFENNFCNHVGKKTYPAGQVYVGELQDDQENGRGVLSDQHGTRIVGVWESGALVEEIVEVIVPAIEVDATNGLGDAQRVFVSTRAPDVPSLTLPEDGREGCALAVF